MHRHNLHLYGVFVLPILLLSTDAADAQSFDGAFDIRFFQFRCARAPCPPNFEVTADGRRLGTRHEIVVESASPEADRARILGAARVRGSVRVMGRVVLEADRLVVWPRHIGAPRSR